MIYNNENDNENNDDDGPIYSQVVNKTAQCGTGYPACPSGEFCCSNGTMAYCGTSSCYVQVASCSVSNNWCGTGNSAYNTASRTQSGDWVYGNATINATYLRQQGTAYCGGTFFNLLYFSADRYWIVRACG